MHLTASRRAGKRVGGGADLPLNPRANPPPPPTQTGLRARHLRSTHPRGCVCVFVGGGVSSRWEWKGVMGWCLRSTHRHVYEYVCVGGENQLVTMGGEGG